MRHESINEAASRKVEPRPRRRRQFLLKLCHQVGSRLAERESASAAPLLENAVPVIDRVPMNRPASPPAYGAYRRDQVRPASSTG
jgi:hypothetical protein